MNFKKSVALLLTAFLLIFQLGIAVTIHYCDDEIASISLKIPFYNQNIEQSCCGKMEQKSKCCKNKVVKSAEKLDQISTKIVGFDVSDFIVFDNWSPSIFSVRILPVQKIGATYYCNAHAPPLYLLYHRLMFYA
ncbi:HYC_CC_PP family protein [Flavobacterium aciduliphilum]|uniref:Uncharacterized protein n=1 Tax=Flavobacterium aciduliphilum TaxID=1101402 RepID=A0A328YHT2_9FLAO|nr:hypothetical protein [Flavobacterium aciduliphilum]RAR71552.1 hypothetical protein CLV55_107108 [Flavobacterium aciduliphilum]